MAGATHLRLSHLHTLILFLQLATPSSLTSTHPILVLCHPRYCCLLHWAFPNCPVRSASSSPLPHMASDSIITCISFYPVPFLLAISIAQSCPQWLSNAAGWVWGWAEQAEHATTVTPLHTSPLAAKQPFDHQAWKPRLPESPVDGLYLGLELLLGQS